MSDQERPAWAEAMERRLVEQGEAMERRLIERGEAMERRIDERAEAMEHRIISEVAKAIADTEHRLRGTMDERFASMHDDITVCLAAIEDRDRRHDAVVSDLRSMRETMAQFHRRLRALELRTSGGGHAGPEAA